MSGAIAQQNALIASNLAKTQQVADARRYLIDIEEQFINLGSLVKSFPEHSTLVLDEMEIAIETLQTYFGEFGDIERARNTKKSIVQLNQSLKNNFSEHNYHILSSLKNYPEKINHMIDVKDAKEELFEIQPLIDNMKVVIKKRRNIAIIPIVLLLILAPLSYSMFATMPSKSDTVPTVVKISTHEFYFHHNSTGFDNVESLQPLIDGLMLLRENENISQSPCSSFNESINALEAAVLTEKVIYLESENNVSLGEWPIQLLSSDNPSIYNCRYEDVALLFGNGTFVVQVVKYFNNICAHDNDCYYDITLQRTNIYSNESNEIYKIREEMEHVYLREFELPSSGCEFNVANIIEYQYGGGSTFSFGPDTITGSYDDFNTFSDTDYRTAQYLFDSKERCVSTYVELPEKYEGPQIGSSNGWELEFPYISYIVENSNLSTTDICENMYYLSDAQIEEFWMWRLDSDYYQHNGYYSPEQECKATSSTLIPIITTLLFSHQ